jgi:hypothetical protein
LADRKYDEHDHNEVRVHNSMVQLDVVSKQNMHCNYFHVVQIQSPIRGTAGQVIVDFLYLALDPKLDFAGRLDASK